MAKKEKEDAEKQKKMIDDLELEKKKMAEAQRKIEKDYELQV